MNAEKLLALAERCEKAEGPDRNLNAEIMEALGIGAYRTGNGLLGYPLEAKPYTASLDAAMTLVPEGWWVANLYFCHPDFRSERDNQWQVSLGGAVEWGETDGFPEPLFTTQDGNATTPALALTAAALRARACDGDPRDHAANEKSMGAGEDFVS